MLLDLPISFAMHYNKRRHRVASRLKAEKSESTSLVKGSLLVSIKRKCKVSQYEIKKVLTAWQTASPLCKRQSL